MKTLFWEPHQKSNFWIRFKCADQKDLQILFDEIDRLESRIKQLELGIEQAQGAMDKETRRQPTEIK